jgi:hypothetical protein
MPTLSLQLGASTTTSSYNAGAVNNYDATSRLVRFEIRNILFYFDALAYRSCFKFVFQPARWLKRCRTFSRVSEPFWKANKNLQVRLTVYKSILQVTIFFWMHCYWSFLEGRLTSLQIDFTSTVDKFMSWFYKLRFCIVNYDWQFTSRFYK